MKLQGKTTSAMLVVCLSLGGAQIALADASMASSSVTPAGMEKCYGIAKAGQNDCDSNAGSSCDKSVIDADPNYFLYVPTGVCNKIVGGMTSIGAGSNPIQNTPALTPPATMMPSSTMPSTTAPATPGSNPAMPGGTTSNGAATPNTAMPPAPNSTGSKAGS
jgi:uncharacterized membrane protein